MRNDVIIYDDKVIKYYSSDVALEYEKAMQLYELSKIYGFIYPQPINNKSEGTIEYRKIATKDELMVCTQQILLIGILLQTFTKMMVNQVSLLKNRRFLLNSATM